MQRSVSMPDLLTYLKKMHCRGLLLWVLQCCAGICLGQESQTRANIQLLGPEQGLPSRNTRCLTQDGRGFMWVGTGQDLWRYDGYTFQNFTATLTRSIGSRTLINEMHASPDGQVWVAHNHGISIIDPVHFTCTTIDPARHIRGVTSKQHLNIIFDPNQNAWVVLSAGRLIKINDKKVPVALYVPPVKPAQPMAGDHVITQLFFGSDQRVYVYHKSDSLEVIDQQARFVRWIDLRATKLAGEYEVASVSQQDAGRLMIYYKKKGSSRLWTRPYSFTSHALGPLAEAHSPVAPTFVYRGKRGFVWYKSEKDIGFMHEKTGVFTSLTDQLRQRSGANVYFFASFLSSDDSFWISCVDGLFKVTLTREIFQKYLSTVYDSPDAIGSSIRGMTEDSAGNIWACSYGFPVAGKTYLLHRINPKQGSVTQLELRRPRNVRGNTVIPYKLLFEKNSIYGITDGTDFLQINPAILEYRPVEFPSVSGRGFTSIYKLNAHTYWLGTWGGMGIIDTRDLKPVLLNDRPGAYIHNERVNHFMPWSKDRILVSTTNGLYVLNRDATIAAHFGHAPDDKISLPALQIFHTVWHENALWAASAEGLIRIDTTQKKARLYTTGDGLPDNNIYAALPDSLGNLWLSTNQGLSRFNTRTRKFRNYGLADGLPHMEFNHGSYLRARNGTLYFGGLNGIVAFDPARLEAIPRREPALQLIAYSKQHADDAGTDTVSNHLSGAPIVFNPGDRFFSFSFMSPDYQNTARNRFRYKLEGWDDGSWHLFDNGNKLVFNTLPPGKYKLRVQVSVAGADWSTQEWQATIRVLAPWYASPLFFIAGLLAVGIAAYFMYRYRLRQILHIQQIRNGISADMHDEIGSTLSSISFYSQALLMQMDKTEHQQVVKKIKENAQQVQEGLSDIVWSVKAGSDEIDDVFARMLHFGTGLAESRGIAFSFEPDPQLENRRLDMQTRKNLYLIFKEGINNAAKYAGGTSVRVTIGYERGRIKMVIRDNGRGFDRNQVRHGNGLTNMQQRAAQMNGQLIIRSEKGEGTSITLVF